MNKALVKAKSSDSLSISDSKPAFLAKHTGPGRGLEGIEQSDLTLPRLGLCQDGTPQRKKTNPKFIPGLVEGQFFNSLTNTIYGEKVLVIPLFMYKSRIKFNDYLDGGGIDCQSFNGKTGGRYSPKSCEECQFSQWKEEKGHPPECDTLYNYPVLLGPKRELVVVSLKSTGIKVAKQWNSLISLREGGADAFAGAYTLTSAGDTKKGNDFFTLSVSNAGWVDEETYLIAEKAYNALRGKKIEVDTTGQVEEEDL